MSRDDLRDKLSQLRDMHDEAHRRRAELQRWRIEERARRSGKVPLDIERIATIAVAIADAQGVEEVSMRKVAAALGAGTMSLYHYVRTKEDLLAAMDDVIMGEVVVPERELKGSWRGRISAIARHTRNAYRRHPWALTLQNKGGPGVNGLRHFEQSLAALADTHLSMDDRCAIMIIVDDFVFGHALRVRQQLTEDQPWDEGPLGRFDAFIAAHVATGKFPQMQRFVGDSNGTELARRMAEMFKPDEWFEIGLEALLNGMERRYNLGT